MSDQAWQDQFWESADGLKLHYRDYAGPADRPPILCIPGLTRNARDFEPIAQAFAGQWRLICVDLRGRGDSDYAKDTSTYAPAQYVADMDALFTQAGLDRVVVIGTSLGGIVAALMAAQWPDRLAGAVLNDIGPVIEETGLARIREYVGQGRSYPTWMHAARALRDNVGEAYPDFSISEWLRVTKRLMYVGNSGRITFDYDMRIADPFTDSEAAEPVDMWPFFKALSGKPTLTLRGELSDILSDRTLERMKAEIAGMETLTIARTGHTPTLDEPEALAAIARLLDKIA
ncbi:alpha/beta fold hydrolase [Alteraurantiacibacter aestuarii]|uniref:Alpha/beta fold hydrolase n=1 Tax=Alteraurantiacibacter aestuarii TaxID=650004 RepID=A0A844ZK25_9SPHN|nr:alpha/beta hydrolase [Alteraurantiacibacter aestuarii]MXO87914.1 alpha/beta fold hydrolase [Alteraurantiacibacter aestuarii]